MKRYKLLLIMFFVLLMAGLSGVHRAYASTNIPPTVVPGQETQSGTAVVSSSGDTVAYQVNMREWFSDPDTLFPSYHVTSAKVLTNPPKDIAGDVTIIHGTNILYVPKSEEADSIVEIKVKAFDGESYSGEVTITIYVAVGDFEFDSSSGTIVKYKGGYEIVNVPATIGGVEVKSIGQEAFKNNRFIKEVQIPDTVTSIKAEAFMLCTSLESMAMPNTLSSIGKDAFSYCHKLKNIILPSGLEIISEATFKQCKALENVTIPSGVKEIGTEAFYQCESLTNISIPGSVKDVGSKSFSDCSALTDVTILGGAKHIGDYAFGSCRSLMTIILPDSIESIGNSAFLNCYELVSIIIPNSVSNIGSEAFSGCKKLTSVDIPGGIISIEMATFFGCENLDTIIIPNTIESIGDRAFAYCRNLKNIDIPESVVSIGNKAFAGCGFESIIIPENIVSIGGGAFSSCDFLKDITIPSKVKAIKEYTFAYCKVLESVCIKGEVYFIGDKAFYYCLALENIALPDSVMNIEDEAFERCKSLKNITIPSSVMVINDRAFYNCSQLSSAYFEGDVPTRFGDDVFKDCGTDVGGFKIYYYPGTEGWDSFSAYPIVAINAQEPEKPEEPEEPADGTLDHKEMQSIATTRQTEHGEEEVVKVYISKYRMIKNVRVAKKENKPVVIDLAEIIRSQKSNLVTQLNLSAENLKAAAEVGLVIKGSHGTQVELPKGLLEVLAEHGQKVILEISKLSTSKVEDYMEQDDTVYVVRDINTNFSGETKLRFPAPADVNPEELVIKVVHSDGTIEEMIPTIVTDEDGNVYLEFTVAKFSTFIIYKPAEQVVEDEDEVPVEVAEETRTKIIIVIDKTTALIDGDQYVLDAAPFIKEGSNRTLVPVRFVSEVLGAEVKWLAETRQVEIKSEGKVILLTINSDIVLLDGVESTIDSPAEIVGVRTFVPLRFVSETLGAEVKYIADTREIVIVK